MKSKTILAGAAALAFLGASVCVQAQITVDGTLDAAYGSALSVQTVDTAWGSGTAANGGNQLDAAYGQISGGNLNLFFAGNTSDGNSLWIFLDDGQAGGQSTFNVAPGAGNSYTSSGSTSLDGSKFSTDFSANNMIDLNTSGGTIYANIYNLVVGTGGYASSAPDAGGTISGVYSITVAVNESSPAGTGSNTGSGALAVNTGWEVAIPMSALNNASSVNVLAGIGSDGGYASNQWLPSENVSSLPFDFSSTPGQYFTVAAVPEPASMAFMGFFGLASLLAIRRKK